MKVSLMALTFGFILAVGMPLAAMAGPTPGGGDTDGDTIEDAFDNCTLDTNEGQEDFDHDGCGDACDLLCDIDGDGLVASSDFVALAGNFGSTTGGPGDCDGDTLVASSDFVTLAGEFGGSVGPSGITNPSRDFTACP